MNDATIRDRARGCLLGLAVGDALGAQVEFKRRGTFPPVTDMAGGGPWNAFPGMWTDDTSMAFAMGSAVQNAGGWCPEAVMKAWLAWRQGRAYGPSDGRGCFDIGGTTSAALSRFQRDGNPFAGSAESATAANGCIMRLAPVAIYTLRMPRERRLVVAAESSRLTHAEPRCVDATCFLSEVLRDWMLSQPADEPPPLQSFDAVTRGLRAVLESERWTDADDVEIFSTGYVLHTLEAAMWAVYGAKDFREAVLRAANLGGDADTVGAVAGQLAGAWWGYDAIPSEWRAKIDRGPELVRLADALLGLAQKQAA